MYKKPKKFLIDFSLNFQKALKKLAKKDQETLKLVEKQVLKISNNQPKAGTVPALGCFSNSIDFPSDFVMMEVYEHNNYS